MPVGSPHAMLVTASGLRNGFLFISRRRQSHRRSRVQILNKLSINVHNGCQPSATQRLSTVGYCNPPSVMSGTPRLGGGGGGTRRGVLERLLTQRRSRHVPVAGGCERSPWFALDATPLFSRSASIALFSGHIASLSRCSSI